MNTYTVEVFEEVGGTIEVQANSPEEAEEKAQEMIDMEGVEAVSGFDVSYRESHTQNPEEVEEK